MHLFLIQRGSLETHCHWQRDRKTGRLEPRGRELLAGKTAREVATHRWETIV